MPKKLTESEAQAKLDAVWSPSVPEMTSSDLQAALEAAGSSYAVVTLLKASGKLRGQVTYDPETQKTTHTLTRV